MKRRHAFLLMAMVLAILAGCNGESWSSGDRVLVAKYLYDSHLKEPQRYDVVVFKYPEKPLKNKVPTNYIKRLLGLPGELLAIFFGRLYRCEDGPSQELRQQFTDRNRSANPLDLWGKDYQYQSDPAALDLFWDSNSRILTGKFKILRKPPATMLTMRRIVYDNDHQAKDLQGVLPPRWAGETQEWSNDQANGFRHAGRPSAEVAWLQYQHILRSEGRPLGRQLTDVDKRPRLIQDFMGYNSYVLRPGGGRDFQPNWVGDLMLEFELTVDRPEGELWVDLARGVDRFQARIMLATGDCTLFRVEGTKKPEELRAAKTHINKAGTYSVRFANFDDSLTLWVDRELPFGEPPGPSRAAVEYKTAGQPGPTKNDLQPARIGSKGAAVQIHHLKLWRDTYYTSKTGGPDANPENMREPGFWSEPERWQALREIRPTTIFVQPGHYLCLGDNSPESSDGREWGSVPERLMLGRALMVYWPTNRAGPIK